MFNISNYVYAGFPFLAIKTMEPLRAERLIKEEIEQTDDLSFHKWDIIGNFYTFSNDEEPQISEEKRLDIAVTYNSHKYVIELKIWRGDAAHQKGLRQLHDYLDRTGLDSGYLVIFDFTQQGQKEWKQEQLQVDGKDIFAVWV